MKTIDLAGQVFGRWTVISIVRKVPLVVHWLCRCECGREDEITSASLRKGLTTGCRTCAQRNRPARRLGRIKNIWAGMIDRCTNPKNPKFRIYGARGIKVCARWLDFEAFFADMGARPSPRHTLDRKNNDGDYEPTNVRWALPVDQGNNRRGNVRVTIADRTQTLAEWARELGSDYKLAHERIARGWEPHRALTTPPDTSRRRKA